MRHFNQPRSLPRFGVARSVTAACVGVEYCTRHSFDGHDALPAIACVAASAAASAVFTQGYLCYGTLREALQEEPTKKRALCASGRSFTREDPTVTLASSLALSLLGQFKQRREDAVT